MHRQTYNLLQTQAMIPLKIVALVVTVSELMISIFYYPVTRSMQSNIGFK